MRPRALPIALVAAGALCAAPATPASAAFHTFKGDRGTSCTIEVGAYASDSLGALSGPPNVGYSAVPTCRYPPAVDGKAGAKRRKACRKPKGVGKRGKPGKRGKRRCGHRKKKRAAGRAAAEFAAPAQQQPAQLLAARLELLTASGGVTSVGEQTMQAPPVGYSCTVGLSTECGDSGRLLPAIPGVSYVPEFDVTVDPPAGESWISRPAGCSSAAAPVCALRAPAVSPKL